MERKFGGRIAGVARLAQQNASGSTPYYTSDAAVIADAVDAAAAWQAPCDRASALRWVAGLRWTPMPDAA